MEEKNKKAKVSVIVPCYNVEKYIEDCMHSVMNQSEKEIEILCIDDASTDNTKELLRVFAAQDSRIRIFENEENKGLSYSRNVGLKNATGEYIMFLDSDDYFCEEAIQTAYKQAKKEGVDILTFESEVDQTECEEGMRLYGGQRKCDYSQILSGIESYLKFRKNGEYICTVWQHLYRREFLDENQIRYYEGILHEDFLFSFKSYMCAKTVLVIKDKLYCYRIRPGSICTSQKFEDHVRGILTSMEQTMKWLTSSDFLIQRAALYELKALKGELANYGYVECDAVKRHFIMKIENPLWKKIVEEVWQVEKFCWFPKKKVDKLFVCKRIYMYGKGKIAGTIIGDIEKSGLKLEGVIVSKKGDKDERYAGYKVFQCDELKEELTESVVIVAVGVRLRDEIIDYLFEINETALPIVLQ